MGAFNSARNSGTYEIWANDMRIFWLSFLGTTQMTIPEIPGVKSNGTKVPGKKLSKIWLYTCISLGCPIFPKFWTMPFHSPLEFPASSKLVLGVRYKPVTGDLPPSAYTLPLCTRFLSLDCIFLKIP